MPVNMTAENVDGVPGFQANCAPPTDRRSAPGEFPLAPPAGFPVNPRPMIRRLTQRLLFACLLAAASATGQQLNDPVDSIFRPAAGPIDTPAPLLPTAGPRPAARRPVPLDFKPGDRILLLGDDLLRGEIDLGYLETRLVSQSPSVQTFVRNLSWFTNTPLANPTYRGDTNRWLTELLAEIARVRPTSVLLGYGTAAAEAGPAGLVDFHANLERLIDGIIKITPATPPTLALFSPSFCEPGPGPADAAKRNVMREQYHDIILGIVTNRLWLYVPAFQDLQYTAEMNEARAKTGAPAPRLTVDGTRLTAYGYSRVQLALQRGLRWQPNQWRFGLQSDNTLRSGGFGIRINNPQRTDNGASLTFLEDVLPAPNPPGPLDLEPDTRPQCYIQIPKLAPGAYEMKVDGLTVLTNTDQDWARFVVVSSGPSWDQAELLRQAIVAKNTRITERWRTTPNSATPGQTDPVLFADPEVMALEAKIRELARPVSHQLEVVRRGSTATAAPAEAPKAPRVRPPLANPPPPPPAPPAPDRR